MNARFQVRKSTSDLQYCLWKVWDTTGRRFVFVTTRETDAEAYARRFERAAAREAAERLEAGTW